MKNILILSLTILTLLIGGGCSEDILQENPTNFINEVGTFSSREGFDLALTGMYNAIRLEFPANRNGNLSMHMATDVATTGEIGLSQWRDYNAELTPQTGTASYFWNWAYLDVLPVTNAIIENQNGIDWGSEEEKNTFIAEAHFIRAYTYNILVNLYNGVPIVDRVQSTPRFDYERASRAEVLSFIKDDLEYAVQWLPVSNPVDGRVGQAAANHLLSEVNISLGRETGDNSFYTAAVSAATAAIDNPSTALMMERFGEQADQPGDVFSDLFKDNNINRSRGNTETLFAIQFEFGEVGGVTSQPGRWSPFGNAHNWMRGWGPAFFRIKDPDGVDGFKLSFDSLGRGVAWVRPTNYWVHEIWNDPNDMRNSEHNVRRDWYFNNPESNFFGQKVEAGVNWGGETITDTLQNLFPMIRKIEAAVQGSETVGWTFQDVAIFRLAETYLLRAEAHMLNGNTGEAAADINIVRARANASAIAASDVDIDFILDERARELTVEEPRRRTLARTGTLVRRVRQYGMLESVTSSIQDHHQWYPIPQSAIDANLDVELTQNPGYN